jgi:hypothetical protein
VQRAYIIIDPQHEYARELIRIAHERHGLKPICVYIDSRAELYKREHFPELRSDLAVGHYYLDQMSARDMATAIKTKFDVVGMMPYFEQSLTPSRELMEALGLKWNSSDVIRRFRDKSGLKDFLRTHHPHIPLGASRKVRSVDDVLGAPLPAKFVIKPNDGFANRDVGFFSKTDSRDAIAAYFGPHPKDAFVLEELLVGTEYAVNGQMDADGKAMVVSVLEYDRVPANGKPNVYHRTIHVPRTDPAYASIAEYAKAVMDASGLKRAPFHLELMLTAEGPRLIEVGARFGGTRYVFATNAVHDHVFNHFDLAVHHYLFEGPYTGPGPNWAFYDRISYVHLDGIAERSERVYTLSGLDTIEAMPEFDGWVVKPEVGGYIRRTVDLYSVPYSVHLKSFKGRADVIAATERVKAALKINAGVTRSVKALVDLKAAANKLRMRGMWLLRRLAA